MSHFSDATTQRGDVLLESLIGVLITALLAAGMAHVAGRIMRSQHDAKVESLIVEQLRSELQVHGRALCNQDLHYGDLTLPPSVLDKQGFVVSSTCGVDSTLAVTVGGVSVDVAVPPSIELSVAADQISGDGAALKVTSVHPPSKGG